MKTVKTNSQQLINILTECVKKSFGLNEMGASYLKLQEKRGLRSQKIFDMIEKHGKPRVYYIDLQSLTDDDILVVNEDGIPLTRAKMKEYDKEFGPVEKITFDDDSYIICKYKFNSDYGNKLGDRWDNRNKLDGKREYRWKNDEAQDLIFKNPYFRKEWEKKYQDKAIDNVRNKRPLHNGFEEL